MELLSGSNLQSEKYKIISKISQGNFGITYFVEQTNLDRKVCIKEFFFRGSCERSATGHVTVTTSGQEMANSFRRKFIREAKRLSQFDHPNIVKVIDVFEEYGTAYMVMDYIEGETLQQLVDCKGKLSESEALEYIIPICGALEVVHDKGLLHLDIKPSNILIKNRTNAPVLIDFGISKFTEVSGEDHSTTTPVALTKGYAPLEQYGQDLTKLTAATDVYSVAATLYKIVTGVTPPEAAVIVQDGIKSPRELNPAISEQLNTIILQALSVKTNHRHQSISTLKADLLEISKRAVVPETAGDTEVFVEIKNPESKSPKPTAPIEKRNYAVLWSSLAFVVLIVLIVLVKSFDTAPGSSNEVRKTDSPVIKAESNYDFVSDYTEGMARVRKGAKWGFIDANSTIIIPLIYDDVSVFSGGKTNVKLEGRWIEIDKNGKEIKNVVENSQPIVNDENNANRVSTSRKTTIYEDPVTDIDGNVYKTVRIGNQVWMAENLKVARYRNGDQIPNVTDNTEWSNLSTGAWCYLNNDVTNRAKYGKLYNYFAVKDKRNIAPEGWHVSTVAEWTKLNNYLGGDRICAHKLREKGFRNWGESNTEGTNETGFTALPGEDRDIDGSFRPNNDWHLGSWWEFSTNEEYSSGNSISPNNSNLIGVGYYKKNGLSVRCIKN